MLRKLGAVAALVVALVAVVPAGAESPRAQPSSRQPVVIEGEAIALRGLRHWQVVIARSFGQGARWKAVRYRIAATELLIEHRWVEGEAKSMGIVVTAKEVRDAFLRMRKVQFPSTREYRRFLRLTRMTRRDLLRGVRIDLLNRRIQERVTQGAADEPAKQFMLKRYRGERQSRWLPKTLCYARWYVEGWCTKA